jgi:hypothetical protein
MPIDLIQEYKGRLVEGFPMTSYTVGKAMSSDQYSFDGAHSIVLKNMVPIMPATGTWNPNRSGDNRFGTVKDLDDQSQVLELGRHVWWTASIDHSENKQDKLLQRAGEFMQLQEREMCMPIRDIYNLYTYAMHAGQTYTLSAALDKDNTVEALLELELKLDQRGVGRDNRWVYVRLSRSLPIRLSSLFEGTDERTKLVLKGFDGRISSLKLVFVPDFLMPQNIEFLATFKDSVIAPVIHKTARILEVAQGFDGPVMEYHTLDGAFVLGKKQDGVIAAIAYQPSAGATQAAQPTFTAGTSSDAGKTIIASSTTGATIAYTLDGSDPKWSKTAYKATGTVKITTPSKATLRAVAYKDGANSLPSTPGGAATDIAEYNLANAVFTGQYYTSEEKRQTFSA